MFRGLLILVVGTAPACDRLYSSDRPPRDAAIDQGSGSDGAVTTTRCSAASMLVGAFLPGADFRTSWWTGAANPPVAFASAAPDVLDVNFPFESNPAGYATLTANTFLDLTEDSFAIAITDPGSFPDVGTITLTLDDPSGRNAVQFQRSLGVINLTAKIDGVQQSVVATAPAYDPADQFWRFANHGGVTTWDTSTTGSDWRMRASLPGLAWLRYARPTLTIERGTAMAPFVVNLSRVNPGAASNGVACPVAQLVDTFAGTEIASRWQVVVTPSAPGRVHLQNEMLALEAPGNSSPAVSALESSTIYDLRGGTVAVQRISSITEPSTVTLFSIVTLDGDRVDFSQNATGYSVLAHGNPTPLHSDTLVGSAWWRFRDDAGRVKFETSGDGTSWDPFAETTDIVQGLDRATIMLGVYQPAGATAPDMVRYDNVGP